MWDHQVGESNLGHQVDIMRVTLQLGTSIMLIANTIEIRDVDARDTWQNTTT